MVHRISEDLKMDALRHYRIDFGTEYPTFAEKLLILVFSPGLHAVAVYRVGRCLYVGRRRGRRGLSFLWGLYRGIEFLVRSAYGIFLDYRAEIAGGFYIGHFGNIFVGPCSIGSGTSIHQQVRINYPSEGFPPTVIGKQVWVGPHVTVGGGVSIGDQVTVSAGSVVKSDVSAGGLVAGNPARLVRHSYDNAALL